MESLLAPDCTEDVLSPDILQLVAKHCSRCTLLRCRLVCRTWRCVFSEALESVSLICGSDDHEGLVTASKYLPSFPRLTKATIRGNSSRRVRIDGLLEHGVTKVDVQDPLSLLLINYAPSRTPILNFKSSLQELRVGQVNVMDMAVVYDVLRQLTALTALEMSAPPRHDEVAISKLLELLPNLDQLQTVSFRFREFAPELLVQLLNACGSHPQLHTASASMWIQRPSAAAFAEVKEGLSDAALSQLQHIELDFPGMRNPSHFTNIQYHHGRWWVHKLECDAKLMGGGVLYSPPQQQASELTAVIPNFQFADIHRLDLNIMLHDSYTHHPSADCTPAVVDTSQFSLLSTCCITIASDSAYHQGIPITLGFAPCLTKLYICDSHWGAGVDLSVAVASICHTCPKLVELELWGVLKYGTSMEGLAQLTNLTQLQLLECGEDSDSRTDELHLEWLPSSLEKVRLDHWHIQRATSGGNTDVQLSRLHSLALNRCIVSNMEVFHSASSSLCLLLLNQSKVTWPVEQRDAQAMFPELIKLIST